MAHGVEEALERGSKKRAKPRQGKMGSRRIFSPQFKLRVLDSYRKDSDCRGNQRATARKFNIHRRQIQKWLQMESALRCSAEGASESEAVALNLAAARQRDDSRLAGCLSEPRIEVDKVSDSEDDLSEDCDQDGALDFTCAALSKRRFFSLDFKLDVLNAFHGDPSCYGNQRATARKFNVHRRQVQKWLDQEHLLRGEENGCLDLSYKKFEDDSSSRTILDLDAPRTQVQETALCLVKRPEAPKELFRPYSLSPEAPNYELCWGSCCTFYTPIHSVTEWLNQDAHYYKQAVKDINLYSPMFS
ncbi:uncharacterized protein LOC106667498 [Cimex lectularius]|uniref:Brinker DNA-binding domain-containing protein n=1 Tax=Cimex lectularius TaxID=79782 RepID=A0A8I6RVM2_CIMLE|nr:uncharacterized protein LOC106667498 [Cimex lectularius]